MHSSETIWCKAIGLVLRLNGRTCDIVQNTVSNLNPYIGNCASNILYRDITNFVVLQRYFIFIYCLFDFYFLEKILCKIVTSLFFILGYSIMAVHKILVLVVAVRICLAQHKLMRTDHDTGYRFSNCRYTCNEVIGEE